MWNRNRYRVRDGFSLGPGPLSPFIKVMLIVNIAVFIAQYLVSGLVGQFALTPATFLQNFPLQLYQIVTYMFLHGGFGHIFFNLFMLWMFGTEVEYSMGTKSFSRFYFLSGISGGLLHLAIFHNEAVPMLGASGAIYGVLAAYWLMFPDRHLYIWFLFPVKVRWAIPGLFLLSILIAPQGVAHFAHAGGAICGLIYLKMDWRWQFIGQKLKNLRYRRLSAKIDRKRREASDMMRRVDAILDKINEVGMENLTKEEKRFLEEASTHLSKQKDFSEN